MFQRVYCKLVERHGEIERNARTDLYRRPVNYQSVGLAIKYWHDHFAYQRAQRRGPPMAFRQQVMRPGQR